MKRDVSIFTQDVLIESSTRGVIPFDTSRVLIGHLEDDKESPAEGVLTQDGMFDGVIYSRSGDEYHVEPASRYFTSPRAFHSIMYRLSDVHFPVQNTCLSQHLHDTLKGSSLLSAHSFSPKHFSLFSLTSEKLQPNVRSRVKPEKNCCGKIYSLHSSRNKRRKTYSKHSFSTKNHTYIYLKKYNPLTHSRDHAEIDTYTDRHQEKALHNSASVNSKYLRLRREVVDDNPIYWRDVDALHYKNKILQTQFEPHGLQSGQRVQTTATDPGQPVTLDFKKSTCMLYLQADHLFYQKMGGEEACIEAMTRHVQRVNGIFRTTDFNQDGRSDNISFMIKRIKVYTIDDLRDPHYRFPGNYGVEKFLELFSEEDYDAFCLAYMFTYRDFEGGTLGLAWTGDLKNAGGVCEKNGHYRGSLKSLNTGIVTLLNYGKHVPPVVSHVTLAHEIGHNFGSPHDPENNDLCTPGGNYGNYIMFARATAGDKKNNNKFSPCSLNSMNAVLNTKARTMRGCFTEPQLAICGNGVVEANEECDCGWEEDCQEPCCFPMRINPPHDQPPCHLRPNIMCSPSQGPCCTHDCYLKIGKKCRDDNGCRSASFCDGVSAKCPPSTNKPNKTICNKEFVCYLGECTGSICVAYGLHSCQCRMGPSDPVTKACEMCCQNPGDGSSCKSSFEWNIPPYDVPDLYAKPGTPCNNYNGYCDVFQRCREVDPSGPLATLHRLLLSSKSIALLKEWLMTHWWGVLLGLIGAVLLMVLSVRVCGKSSRKSKGKEYSEVSSHLAARSNSIICPDLNSTVVKSQSQTVVSNQGFPATIAHTSSTEPVTSNFVKTSLTFRPLDRPFSNHGMGWV
ncbi:disintegrin and metalloproteinase domain-containing protein 10-like [Limulus polyphemus]|uniref:ADAM10 endopeptidase n=1 Tax=Limulus polyphemus TaxID=6850 RepID=A0ABM1S4H3_LIMPO|nr:disintegrin and metalloproteinase domain-containing protein 10-like [Limulus polyphemus]